LTGIKRKPGMGATLQAMSAPALPLPPHNRLRMRRMGIDTYQEPVLYMHRECPVCHSEGFEAQSRVQLSHAGRTIVGTLNVVDGDFLTPEEVGLSEAAWRLLDGGGQGGSEAVLSHPSPLDSLTHVRAKAYGRQLSEQAFREVIADVASGRFSDLELAAFITACAGDRLSLQETTWLTRAMVESGERIDWGAGTVMDKHSVGGLPGNRTSMIIVPIVAACGLRMPKTSSRAITSPAGTADTMETLAPVDLDVPAMRRVVDATGGCIVWGGSVRLSPADDILIRVERPLDLDSQGQMVASILSKKAAAGSTHVVIDMPVGPTAKVRGQHAAESLKASLEAVAEALGLEIRVVQTEGVAPVGRGIGPALEARDVLAVLRNEVGAPQDLLQRGVALAGHVLEFGGAVPHGGGAAMAMAALKDGRAWKKMLEICEAQGGFHEPPVAAHHVAITAHKPGVVAAIDNRRLSKIAKLAGAPHAAAAGVELLVRPGDAVERGQPVFMIHATSPGSLAYALEYAQAQAAVLWMIEETGLR
jgi:thymidine phosphorylase